MIAEIKGWTAYPSSHKMLESPGFTLLRLNNVAEERSGVLETGENPALRSHTTPGFHEHFPLKADVNSSEDKLCQGF